jgi:hypothetical protein
MKARNIDRQEDRCMSVNQTSDGEFKNFWQLVFNQSRVNGAAYFGDRLPCYSWDWPKNTFLQRRLHQLRKQRGGDLTDTTTASRKPLSSLNRKRRPVHHEQPNWLGSAHAAQSLEEH